MPLTLAACDKILRDTYGVAMRRDAANSILNPNPLQRMLGMTPPPEDIAAAWATLRELATTHPTITRSPFDGGIDWDELVAPEYTQRERQTEIDRHRAEVIAAVERGEYDD